MTSPRIPGSPPKITSKIIAHSPAVGSDVLLRGKIPGSCRYRRKRFSINYYRSHFSHLNNGHPLSFKSSILNRRTSSVVPKNSARCFKHMNFCVLAPSSLRLIPIISLSVISLLHLQHLCVWLIVLFSFTYHSRVFSIRTFECTVVDMAAHRRLMAPGTMMTFIAYGDFAIAHF